MAGYLHGQMLPSSLKREGGKRKIDWLPRKVVKTKHDHGSWVTSQECLPRKPTIHSFTIRCNWLEEIRKFNCVSWMITAGLLPFQDNVITSKFGGFLWNWIGTYALPLLTGKQIATKLTKGSHTEARLRKLEVSSPESLSSTPTILCGQMLLTAFQR